MKKTGYHVVFGYVNMPKATKTLYFLIKLLKLGLIHHIIEKMCFSIHALI